VTVINEHITDSGVQKWESVAEIATKVANGELSAVSLVNKAIDRAKEVEDYNAVLQLIEGRSRERAKQIDINVKAGKTEGKLLGVPFIAKDNFLTFDSETTAASNILKGFHAPYQATAIERLEAEGAICIGKANLDAFAHGSSTENSDFGVTKNAHDKERVPGGSSGGSTTAVALEIVPFALGSDTGGSIRQPASLSGVVGMKPTYGLVSRYGVIAMASSTDVIGVLANSTQDVSSVMAVIAGRDEYDSTSIKADINFADKSTKQFKVALIKEYMEDGLDPAVRKQIEKVVNQLKESGVNVDEISMPSLKYALAAYYIVVPAEVSSNLARYDGVKFGHRAQADTLEGMYEKSRAEGFGYEAKRRIMIGSYVLSSGFYDAYYQKAQKVRTLIINDFNRAFVDYDLLIGPVSPSPAFKIGEKSADPLSLYLEDIMTVAISLAGLPAISVPTDTGDELPVGLQIIGKQQQDDEVIELASMVEELQNG